MVYVSPSVQNEMKELIANLRSRNRLFLQLLAIYVTGVGVILSIAINNNDFLLPMLIIISLITWSIFSITIIIRKNIKLEVGILHYYQKEISNNKGISKPIRYLHGGEIYNIFELNDLFNVDSFGGFDILFIASIYFFVNFAPLFCSNEGTHSISKTG